MAKEKTDQQVFEEFKLGPDQKTLRKLVSSQRRVNGRLYKSIEAILDAFPKPAKRPRSGAKRGSGHKTAAKSAGLKVNLAKLAKADKINEKVPGEGVGCNSGHGGN
jgi:hypothetical protein